MKKKFTIKKVSTAEGKLNKTLNRKFFLTAVFDIFKKSNLPKIWKENALSIITNVFIFLKKLNKSSEKYRLMNL